MNPTAAGLLSRLRSACIERKKRLALPESLDPRILTAASRLLEEGAASKITLCASRAEGLALATSLGLELGRFGSSVEWTKESGSDLEAMTRKVLSDRSALRGKTLVPDKLALLAASPLTQACALLEAGETDAVLAGAVFTTADVIRAALATVGLREGVHTMSGSFVMNREHGHEATTYLYADSGVVIDPTSEQLVDIAVETVSTWRRLMPTVDPVVAFLSFSTHASASHPMAEKVARAAKFFKSLHPEIESDGEMQFDAAFDASVGARKCPGSKVPGRANCFIFPSLDAGNIAYKITQRLGGFDAYGPILQGSAKPVSDLSRGASAEDIVAASYLIMLRA